MSLDQLAPYAPAVAVAAGVLMLLWGQRDRLQTLLGRFHAVGARDVDVLTDDEDAELTAHEAYGCLRRLLEEVQDCPKATEALQFVVLPAIVSGADAPHYQVTWEAKP